MGAKKAGWKYDNGLIISGLMLAVLGVIFHATKTTASGIALAFGFSGLALLLSGISSKAKKK